MHNISSALGVVIALQSFICTPAGPSLPNSDYDILKHILLFHIRVKNHMQIVEIHSCMKVYKNISYLEEYSDNTLMVNQDYSDLSWNKR